MMRLSRLWAALTVIFYAITAATQSVPVESGLKPYGSFHGGDIDLVSLRDGVLNLHIPLVSWPQRGGLHLGFFIGLNDASIVVTPDTRSSPCDRGCGKDFGPGLADGIVVYPDFLPSVQWSGPFNTTSGKLLGQPAGIYDGMGTTHSFFNLFNGESGANNPPPPNNTPIPSLDGSGYTMTLTAGSCPTISNYASAIVQDRHGVRYTYPTSCLNPLNLAIEDPNGNQMTVSNVQLGDLFNVVIPNDPPAGTAMITDSMGRSIVAPPGPNSGSAGGQPGFGQPDGLIAPAVFAAPGPAASTSGCTGSPAATSAQLWSVPGPAGGTETFKFCFTQICINISSYSGCAFQNTAVADANCFVDYGPYTRLSSIVLPDGSAWGFTYDSAPANSSSASGAPMQIGDLIGITLPTGGTISYTWGGWQGTDSAHRKGGVITRTVNASDGTGSHQWTYSGAGSQTQNANGTLNPTQVVTTVTDPVGNISVHTLVDLSGALSLYETLSQEEDPSGNVLRTVQTAYSEATTTASGVSLGNGAMNVFPLSVTTTLPNGLVTNVQKDYDFNPAGNYGGVSFGTVTAERDYDYGIGSPGPLLRQIVNSYVWQSQALSNSSSPCSYTTQTNAKAAGYQANNIIDAPTLVQVQSGNCTLVAQTAYGYDETALVASGISTQHDSSPPAGSARGNQTSSRRWLNTSGTFLPTTQTFYDTGMVAQITDPLGNTTTHSYDPAYAGAYSTQTKNALGQVVSGTYDFNTGLLTSFTDANGSSQATGSTPGDPAHTTTLQYNDPLGRVTQIQSPPDPSGNHPTTTFTYSAANSFPVTIQRQKTITSSLTDSFTTLFDGLARQSETQHVTPNCTVSVMTSYDADGRTASVTNPFCSTSDPTYGVTSYQYDPFGRLTQTTKQDGSATRVAYDVTAPSGVNGDCAVSTDEAGNSRRACTDGLGRLIEVDEPGDPIVNFNGAAAPATAVYSMTGFPDSYGEHDMYVGTDGHIYQLYLSPSGWVNQDLTAMTGGELATSHSAMTSFTDSFGDHVLYVGSNQHIYQMYFSGGAWQNQDLSAQTGNTLAASGTGLSSFADASGEHILYAGSNQHVYELLFSSGTGWQNEDLSSQTGNTLAASNTGFTNFADSYGEHVFYEGANQHIQQLYGSEGSWQNQDLTEGTGNTLASAPTVLSSLVDSYGEHVFYFSSSQHLEQLYFSSGVGWQNQDLTQRTGNTLAAAGSSLSSFVDSMGEHVFYEGTNQHVYSMYFSGSEWSNQDLTAMAAGTGATSGGGLTSYSDGEGEHVFYAGGGQGVYELSWAAGSPWEATNIGGPSLAQNYYVSQYSYDALGNLLNVTQKGDPTVSNSSQYRVRTFSYDSLSRLLTATNPESGAISYSYDADGNVLQKTSPAPNQTGAATQIISYCYDTLNRVTGKVYAAQGCPLNAPVVSYAYDAGANGIGHLTSLVDAAGTGSYGYDALGRITSEQRTIAGVQKNLSYSYNLDNSLATLTYPSSAVVTYTPDSAGRMISAVDSGNNINYVTGASYGPDSSLTGFVSGSSSGFNGISNSLQYNPRLQICRITALTTGSSPSSCTDSSHTGNVLDLGYNLNLGAGDNGNVIGITNYKDSTRSQSFTYDALNRLTSAQNAGTNCNQTTAAGSPEYWGNSYGYDAWGNLLQKTVTKCNAENLNVTALANNQLSGYGYDAAGNMTHDATTGNNYSYDQENRITGAAGYTYTYDADGNRVEKSNGSTGTVYWYMTPGIVAESDLSGNLKSEYVFFNGERVARKDFPGGAVSYYFSDHLKTASVVTRSSGTITEDEDYYPWGGEIWFVNNDSNHYKFTGKERDAETGLDYFGVRYYGNWTGRFLSADWSEKPEDVPYADLDDPQSLNLYSYVRNVPTSRIDLDGHQQAGEAVLNWVLSNPKVMQALATAGNALKSAATTVGEVASEAATTATATVTITVVYLISPGSGGANAHNDTLEDQYKTGTPATTSTSAQTGTPASTSQAQSKAAPVEMAKEHTKNARPSTAEKHQEGRARARKDRGGEKGDARRRPPRKRPDNWKGPWPPKPKPEPTKTN